MSILRWHIWRTHPRGKSTPNPTLLWNHKYSPETPGLGRQWDFCPGKFEALTNRRTKLFATRWEIPALIYCFHGSTSVGIKYSDSRVIVVTRRLADVKFRFIKRDKSPTFSRISSPPLTLNCTFRIFRFQEIVFSLTAFAKYPRKKFALCLICNLEMRKIKIAF